MNTEKKNLKALLDELILFLNNCGEANWKTSLTTFRNELELTNGSNETLKEIASGILRIYGGMGSFSDLILYDNSGQIAVAETDKLNELRSKLFNVAMSIR